MRSIRLIAGILTIASLAHAQDTRERPPVSQEPAVAEVIRVKTLTGDAFNRLGNLLSVFNYRIGMDEKLRAIVVYAPKDVVAEMKRIVEELDRPGSDVALGRNIEMTLTLLLCSTKAPAAPNALPDDIEPVAKQLRAATQYKDVQLWDVIPIRVQEGKESTSELQLPGVENHPALGSMKILPESATRKGAGWSVRFNWLNFSFKMPLVTGTTTGQDGKTNLQFSYQEASLKTSGDFVEGQKTVLGKVSGMNSDTAIFVVISLKVLE